MGNIIIDDTSLAELTRIFEMLCPKSIIWAFGSRIDGSAHPGSDLDLAIVDYGQKDTDYIELKETLTQSNIPFLIDIFGFNKLPESFRREIKRNYVVLYDGRGQKNQEVSGEPDAVIRKHLEELGDGE